jgi:hypothetical protein
MKRKKSNKLTGRAIAAQRLRETTECECGSYKPALVTVTKDGKVVGYCEDCIERR